MEPTWRLDEDAGVLALPGTLGVGEPVLDELVDVESMSSTVYLWIALLGP